MLMIPNIYLFRFKPQCPTGQVMSDKVMSGKTKPSNKTTCWILWWIKIRDMIGGNQLSSKKDGWKSVKKVDHLWIHSNKALQDNPMRGFGSTRTRPRLKGSKGKLPTTKVPRGLTFLVVQLVGEFVKPVVAIQRVPPRATVAPRRLEPRRLAPSAVRPNSPVAVEQNE